MSRPPRGPNDVFTSNPNKKLPNGYGYAPGEPVDQMPLPQRDPRTGEPVCRYKNMTSSSLTDQCNGLIMVLGNEYVQTGPPHGTWIYEDCVKVEGCLTAQVNGLVVGVEGGITSNQPRFPNMTGAWSGCQTVEKLPDGVVPTKAEIEFARELDSRSLRTLQINGGLIAPIRNSRIFVPQLTTDPHRSYLLFWMI
ncbi:unnamed protein product [Clonostachys byssicola]|uniref:Uncharacterized protein n=1 Tax=Clonostachys byssicola TaxID=160290 RepID=A0A9N9Y5D0_9HYPO|nr:unnamed protein product [Clonostachys byssicola]